MSLPNHPSKNHDSAEVLIAGFAALAEGFKALAVGFKTLEGQMPSSSHQQLTHRPPSEPTRVVQHRAPSRNGGFPLTPTSYRGKGFGKPQTEPIHVVQPQAPACGGGFGRFSVPYPAKSTNTTSAETVQATFSKEVSIETASPSDQSPQGADDLNTDSYPEKDFEAGDMQIE